jgi:hypothetical protein
MDPSSTPERDEIFDEFIRGAGLGPRVTAADAPNAASWAYIGEFISIAKQLVGGQRQLMPSMPEVYFNFYQGYTLNAFVFKHEHVAFIGLSIAAVTVLSTVFRLMLSDQGLLPDIGDSMSFGPRRKTRQRSLISGPLHDIRSIQHLLAAPVTPRDQDRYAFAEHLTRAAYAFLVAHECSHIARGHLGYLQSRGCGFHFESHTENFSPENLDLQALEVDADCAAMSILKNIRESNRNHPERLSANVRQYYKDVKTTHRHGLFAVLLLFRLLDEPVRGRSLGCTSHPFAPIRESYLITRLVGFLESTHPDVPTGEWTDLVRRVAADVQTGIRVLRGGQADDAELHYAAKAPEIVQHVNFLFGHFGGLKKELQIFAHVELNGYR